MMWNVVASDRVLYRLVKSRDANPTIKEGTVSDQENFTVFQNKPYDSVYYKDDIERLIRFYLKTQVEGLTLLAYILPRTCISCKEKEKFIDYLIKVNQSEKQLMNTQAGSFFCQTIGKQNVQQPGIFYNYKTGSEYIFRTNKEHSFDEPIEITKDKLNPTTNSSTHSRINKSNKETTSKKKTTGNTNLKATNRKNNNKK